MLSLNGQAAPTFRNLPFIAPQLFDELLHLPLADFGDREIGRKGGLITHHCF
jgi:hypothetical protein